MNDKDTPDNVIQFPDHRQPFPRNKKPKTAIEKNVDAFFESHGIPTQFPPINVGMLKELLKDEDAQTIVCFESHSWHNKTSVTVARFYNSDYYLKKFGASVQPEFFLEEDFHPSIASEMQKVIVLSGGITKDDLDEEITNPKKQEHMYTRLFGSKRFATKQECVAWLFESTEQYLREIYLGEDGEQMVEQVKKMYRKSMSYAQALKFLRQHVNWVDVDECN